MDDSVVDRRSLLGMIDNTMLEIAVSVEEIADFCRQSAQRGFGAVAVNSAMVGVARAAVDGSACKVCSAIGFPLGAVSTFCKAAEIRDAIASGADELDFVANINMIKSGRWSYVSDEICRLVQVCEGRTAKVILETSLLSREEMLRMCDIAVETDVTFIKTSTGFRGGTTVDEIRMLRERVGSRCGVKATGGIRDLDGAISMVAAGADRIGTSKGFAILDELDDREIADAARVE